VATDDIQRLVTGSEATPARFKIPGNGQLRPKVVYAGYDGSGAGGAFIPALKVISDAGEVVGVFPAADSDQVAAGASANVTWFPGGGVGGASGGTFQWCRVVCGPATPSNGVTNLTSGTVMPIISFDTSDPANYTQVDANTWSIPAVPQTVSGYMQVDGGPLTTLNGDVNVGPAKLGGATVPTYGQNTLKLLQEYFGYTLTRSLEYGGHWQAFAAGTDTHSFDVTVTYAAVY
jgi:hypothetical protein